MSSSSTILTTCWPGLSFLATSIPAARSLTAFVNCLTTLKLTSASSSASRISRIARLMSSSVSAPRWRTPCRVPWSFSERDSNTGLLGYRRVSVLHLALRGRRVSGGRRRARRLGFGGPVRAVRARIRIEGGCPGAAAGSARSRGRRRFGGRRRPGRGLDRGRAALVEPVVRDGLERAAVAEVGPARPRARAAPAPPRARRAACRRRVVVEMGAGTSRTIAGLWAPAAHGLRYVATDISRPALLAGRGILGPVAASVQCDAVGWPVREGVADARDRARRPAPRLRLAGRAGSGPAAPCAPAGSCCCTRR